MSLPPPPPPHPPLLSQPKRIKRQRRKLRGKYSGDCVSCNAKWSKCWYIASVDNQPEWEARLGIVIHPLDDEVCFQCWDGKIRTSPKRKQSKIEEADFSFTPHQETGTSGSEQHAPSPLRHSSIGLSTTAAAAAANSPPTTTSTTAAAAATWPTMMSSTTAAAAAADSDRDSPRKSDSPRRSEHSPRKAESSPRKSEDSSSPWNFVESSRGNNKRAFVDDYGAAAEVGASSTAKTTAQIRKTQIGGPRFTNADESVFEEHEAVFLLSTAFKTFPSNLQTSSINAVPPNANVANTTTTTTSTTSEGIMEFEFQ